MLAPDLVALLVCPESKQPLLYFPRGAANRSEDDAFLLCASSRLRFRVDQGVPVLLAEEAERLAPADVDALVRRAAELGLA